MTTQGWLEEGERGSRWLLIWIRNIAEKTPDWVANPLIWLVSVYFTLFPTRHSAEGTKSYLTAVLGAQPGFWQRHQHVRTFAHVIFDRVSLLAGGLDGFEIRPSNHELILHHLRRQQPCILLGAHFGSFEALRAFDRQLPGLSVRYLMFSSNADKTSPLLEEVNPAVASQVISLTDGRSAMLAVREALDDGHFVAFLGDRMPVQNMRAATEVAFMGRPVSLPRAPYLSAILAQVPLILCFSPLVGKKAYEIVFSEIYDGRPVARDDREATCQALAQRYADALAEMCCSHPYNWFNFFDIWRDNDRSDLR